MANVETGFLVKNLFGLIPKTFKIESDEAALKKDHEEFQAFGESQELADYLFLEKEVTSKEFIDRFNFLKNQKFSDTDQYKKEQEYLKLKGAHHIASFYKVKASDDLRNCSAMDVSQELKDYQSLEKEVNSKEFAEKLGAIKSYTFEKTEEYKKLMEFNQLKKQSTIKKYYKVKKSSNLAAFNKTDQSGIIDKLNDLEKQVSSRDFASKKAKLESEKAFANSSESQLEKEYLRIKNSSEVKKYYKYKISAAYENFKNLDGSKDILKYEELAKITVTREFLDFKNEMEDKNRYMKTEEYQRLAQFEILKKQPKFVAYFRFKESSAYNNFMKLDGSSEVAHFEELEKYLNSSEFLEFKKDMLDKYRIKKTEEYQNNEQYLNLKKSPRFQKYFALKSSDKFAFFNKWQLSFEDDFEGKQLNRSLWITMYYWGKKLLGESYSLSGERHYFTDGKNVEVNDGVLKIFTRKEKANGKIWNENGGFAPADFDFTSGIINSGESFRQKYGIFKAKIRFSNSTPVNHLFWLSADKKVPQLVIVRTSEKHKFIFSSFWSKDSKHSISDFNGSKFLNNFFIYTLEWSSDKLIWKINDVPVKVQTNNIPQEPMYINFSSGVFSEASDGRLPAQMEIDWVRCYSTKN